MIEKNVDDLLVDLSVDDDKVKIPSIIKYMGSKKPILDFIISNIELIHIQDQPVCDLFSGSCTISAALRKSFDFISNDIQEYSSILAQTYFSDLSKYDFSSIEKEIKISAQTHVNYFIENFNDFFFDYTLIKDMEEYQKIEKVQRDLIDTRVFDIDYFLFTKYYSGTYWSFEQCVWIDALRKSCEKYKGTRLYYAVIASIMYAMSYTTQSTGHFAQYRSGKNMDAVNNIILYRLKDIYNHFSYKLEESLRTLDNSLKAVKTTTLSFKDCLELVPVGCTVYADPPYAPVHYSRFYHVLETIVKYDYPELEHKGRYRTNRHQSPFSQKSNAPKAFKELFEKIVSKKAQMLLSYSNTGVLEIDSIVKIASQIFKDNIYILEVREVDHKHSTMGRFEDQNRDVTEYLIIAKLQ